MSYEPGNHDRRLVSADGHLLSVDRRTARLDVQAWFNRVDDPDADLRPYRRGDTWTRYGYSFRDDLNTTPGPCPSLACSCTLIESGNTHSWNPSSACPSDNPASSLRQCAPLQSLGLR